MSEKIAIQYNSYIKVFIVKLVKGIDQMLELLWQIGILSTVLIFGIKIGLAMGFAGLSKKIGIAIAIVYGLEL